MQYLPVVFAVFQVFFLTGLVIYYMAQAILRIAQQAYITRAFYGHDESLGRQAQRAGERPARWPSRTVAAVAGCSARPSASWPPRRPKPSRPRATEPRRSRRRRPTPPRASTSKRTTPPKDRPTPTRARPPRRDGRPPSRRPEGSTTKSAGKVGATERRRAPPPGASRDAGRRDRRGYGMGRNDRKTIERPRNWPSISWASLPTTPSSRCSSDPEAGLFGRLRGEARVRARVRPAQVRPKQERRRRRTSGRRRPTATPAATAERRADAATAAGERPTARRRRRRRARGRSRRSTVGDAAATTPTVARDTSDQPKHQSSDDRRPTDGRGADGEPSRSTRSGGG